MTWIYLSRLKPWRLNQIRTGHRSKEDSTFQRVCNSSYHHKSTSHFYSGLDHRLSAASFAVRQWPLSPPPPHHNRTTRRPPSRTARHQECTTPIEPSRREHDPWKNPSLLSQKIVLSRTPCRYLIARHRKAAPQLNRTDSG